MTSVLASASRVTKRYGAFTAVDTVTMDVRPGEIVGLLGANGAGKTTLIRLLLGLTVPTEGTVAAFGRTPDRTTRGRLGYVPQGLGLWQTLTVEQNITFACAAFRSPPPDLEPALAALRKRPVAEIGLGLQRRLAFAIALAHRPELLILDEPTSGVDPLSRARLWDAVHDEADHGTAVLVTTHYMQEAQQCDRLILMARGKAVAAGSRSRHHRRHHRLRSRHPPVGRRLHRPRRSRAPRHPQRTPRPPRRHPARCRPPSSRPGRHHGRRQGNPSHTGRKNDRHRPPAHHSRH